MRKLLLLLVTALALAVPANALAATKTVNIYGAIFQPARVTVDVGDTVKWTNKDQVGHSVTTRAGQPESFDSNPNCSVAVLPAPACMASGATYTHTFTKAGTTEYYCRAHSMMTAKVVVLEHDANMTM